MGACWPPHLPPPPPAPLSSRPLSSRPLLDCMSLGMRANYCKPSLAIVAIAIVGTAIAAVAIVASTIVATTTVATTTVAIATVPIATLALALGKGVGVGIAIQLMAVFAPGRFPHIPHTAPSTLRRWAPTEYWSLGALGMGLDATKCRSSVVARVPLGGSSGGGRQARHRSYVWNPRGGGRVQRTEDEGFHNHLGLVRHTSGLFCDTAPLRC